MKTNNAGLRALTTSKERQEIRAVGTRPEVRLRYRGRMEWMRKAGHDGRIWDVLAPKLAGYPADGYPTLTLDGLKEKNLI